jgi:hypothetical protein
MANPVVFFDMTVGGAPAGRIEMTVRPPPPSSDSFRRKKMMSDRRRDRSDRSRRSAVDRARSAVVARFVSPLFSSATHRSRSLTRLVVPPRPRAQLRADVAPKTAGARAIDHHDAAFPSADISFFVRPVVRGPASRRSRSSAGDDRSRPRARGARRRPRRSTRAARATDDAPTASVEARRTSRRLVSAISSADHVS